MFSNLTRIALASLAAIGLMTLAVGCGPSYGFKVIDAGEGMITVSDARSEEVKTHEVAPNAVITRDGEPADLEQLEQGDNVNITVEEREKKIVATKVEARSIEPRQIDPTAPVNPTAPVDPLDPVNPTTPVEPYGPADPEPLLPGGEISPAPDLEPIPMPNP